MTHLTFLDLAYNEFTGTIPESIGNLTKLTYLDLSKNKFSGIIPKSIGSLTKLTWLDLSDNSFYGTIPREFGNLTNLEVLYLDSLRSCRVENLDWLSSLSSLEVLTMDGTSLAKANNWFDGNLSDFLNTLSTSATTLESLDASNNQFTGSLSDEIQQFSFLTALNLSLNQLNVLSLKSNNLFGTIPSQICQLESLQILDLSFNNLHGTIPPCVNNLTSMVQKGFFLEQNKHHYSVFINSRGFIGNSYIDHLLIAWQGKVNEFNSILGLLKAVDLSSNNLTGQIPNEVTNLHGLNMFLEEMPSSMSDMHSLNDLDVSFNNLSGRVPSSTQLQSLILSLSREQIVGFIMLFAVMLKRLIYAYLMWE
ncbi:leucine-rich repeat-containing protein [Tanacetum coccineum]